MNRKGKEKSSLVLSCCSVSQQADFRRPKNFASEKELSTSDVFGKLRLYYRYIFNINARIAVLIMGK